MMRLEQPEVLATRGEEMVMSALETLKAPSPAAANCAASAIPPPVSLKSLAPKRAMRQRKSAQDDARLIERLKAGNQDALEAIFNLYSAKLYNVALRILGDAGDTTTHISRKPRVSTRRFQISIRAMRWMLWTAQPRRPPHIRRSAFWERNTSRSSPTRVEIPGCCGTS